MTYIVVNGGQHIMAPRAPRGMAHGAARAFSKDGANIRNHLYIYIISIIWTKLMYKKLNRTYKTTNST